MVWRGTKIHKIIFQFREEESSQGQIQELIIGNQEIMDQNKIQNELQLFYRNFSNLTVQNNMLTVRSFQIKLKL